MKHPIFYRDNELWLIQGEVPEKPFICENESADRSCKESPDSIKTFDWIATTENYISCRCRCLVENYQFEIEHLKKDAIRITSVNNTSDWFIMVRYVLNQNGIACPESNEDLSTTANRHREILFVDAEVEYQYKGDSNPEYYEKNVSAEERNNTWITTKAPHTILKVSPNTVFRAILKPLKEEPPEDEDKDDTWGAFWNAFHHAENRGGRQVAYEAVKRQFKIYRK